MANPTTLGLPISQYTIRTIDKLGSFLLAATAVVALMINAAFYESLPSLRLGVVLLALLLLHTMLQTRVLFSREFSMYAMFLIYMFIQLLWTDDIPLATNTLVPAFVFIVTLTLFGSLIAFHDFKVVLAGILGGFMTGAAIHTLVGGFPFVHPAGFSYNAVALMYLFGLFITLLLASYNRSKFVLPFISLILMGHVVATTSIKANLGVLLGAVATSVVYFGYFRRTLWRNLIPLVVLAGLLGFAITSNEMLIERLEGGVDRISLGVEVLQARENVGGYGSFESRSNWLRQGLIGWGHNPVFGYGVEAFRSRNGITSHSSPVDLLYNSGVIGFLLFYSIFLSLFRRVYSIRNEGVQPICALIFGTTVCFLFVTMSGTVHYNYFLAAFIAIGVGLLRRYELARHAT